MMRSPANTSAEAEVANWEPPVCQPPCGGCTACCQGNDMVRLLEGDDPEAYQVEPHPFYAGERMLAHKPNGDCVYLAETGCTIHARRPQMCREMDCRLVALHVSFTEQRKLPRLPYRVWRKGRELLRRARQRRQGAS